MDYSKNLADYVANTNYQDIPKKVVDWAKVVMLDTLSCAVAGFSMAQEECKWVEDFVGQMGGSEQATIWKSGVKTSAVNAALANATMVHTVDFDDTHLGSVAHLGAGLLGTVLALGELQKASGKEVITAFILGFEVGARVGNSVNANRTHYKYWHPTATFGTIACSVAAAKLMKFSSEDVNKALGLGVDQAMGFRYCIDKGDFSKSLHPGFAAMRGVMSAQIVNVGATAPVGLLEYETGFCNAMANPPIMDCLLEDLGREYFVLTDSLKFFPTIHCSHTGIEAMLNLVSKHNLTHDIIESIDIKVTELAKGQGMTFNPKTTLAARLSIPYSVATAAVKGRLTLKDFDEDSLNDENTIKVMSKITIDSNPEFNRLYPTGLVTQMIVKTTCGKEYKELIIYPKGHPERPVTQKDIDDKYEFLTTITWNKEKSDNIKQLMYSLDNTKDIGEFIKTLIK